jgi:hypothetical protein
VLAIFRHDVSTTKRSLARPFSTIRGAASGMTTDPPLQPRHIWPNRCRHPWYSGNQAAVCGKLKGYAERNGIPVIQFEHGERKEPWSVGFPWSHAHL